MFQLLLEVDKELDLQSNSEKHTTGGLELVDLPPVLVDSVKEQRAILFLGAGASWGAMHPKGHKIPQGDALRDLISDKFLGGELKDKPLTTVSAIASKEAGLAAFQLFIRDLFLPYEPADFHRIIPKFRWRLIATTNFDLIVEKAYESEPTSPQNIVKTVKDGDSFDTRLSRETNPVGFYKLHGCIDHSAELDIPLILGSEQYASYEKNRTRFYARFRDLGMDYPIIFAGYSISDPHIQRFLFDLTDQQIARPPYYMISPDLSDLEIRYWAGYNVVCIKATLQNFLESLDNAIPEIARALPISVGGGELSIRRHYRVRDAEESQLVLTYLETDAHHIHSGLVPSPQEASKFYNGYDNGFGSIVQNLDAKRAITDSVLVDAVLLADEDRKQVELFLLKGPAGNGKTVALKRIAWEAGVTYDQLVFYVDSSAGIRVDPIAEVHRLTGKRIYLFVDHVALVRNELRDLLSSARSRSIPLTIIGSERDNEWSMYCDQLEPFLIQDFSVRYLSESEIRDLLTLLERHRALGLLETYSKEDRIRAFTQRAERQLLVALHEATLGTPFEDILFDEFRRIEPATARELYLDICALHQFGAPVRAGLISRASGIGFEQFTKDFILPLRNVVQIVEDNHSKDIHYTSRHRHVAEILFNRVLPAADDRFDLLARLLLAINVDYSSDRETFARMIRGRGIVELFSNIELGRLFYDRVQDASPNDPFVFHQRAVFEMQHPGGSLSQAETAAARASELNPTNHSIQHTQAEISRRLANETTDPLRKQALRRATREKLGNFANRLSEYDYYTKARVAIDEFRELSDTLATDNDDPPSRALLNAAKEAETAIQSGLQLHPENADLLAAEATFRDILNQGDRAQRVLEKAFSSNPRQDWLAVRLARRYFQSGQVDQSLEVLEKCLQDNPSSKIAHLQLGRIMLETGDVAAIEHLRRGFTEGDNQFEAQFWYARQLFLTGEYSSAEQAFGNLNERAPGRFRTRADTFVEKEGGPSEFNGTIARKEEGYAFINIPPFPRGIFASRSESDPESWELLSRGDNAKCNIAFNRRGPRAVMVEQR
jgi:tetratricopeptide (TPR) repeat protein